MALRRITKELKDIEASLDKLRKQNILNVGPVGDDLFKWKATIIGTEGTPYQGGHYDLSITIPQDYPFKPPKIKFETKIYHCNINGKGGIDCDILRDNYAPSLTIVTVLMCIITVMSTGGNIDDPLRLDVAKEMKTNMELFVKTASEWNVKYANGKPAPNPINATSFPWSKPWQNYCKNKKAFYKKFVDQEKRRIDAMNKYQKNRFNDNSENNNNGIFQRIGAMFDNNKPYTDISIFIKTLTGKLYTIKCRSTDFIITIKMLLQREHGFPVKQQKLIYAGRELQDHYSLSDYNIYKEHTLHLVFIRLKPNLNKENDKHKGILSKNDETKVMKMYSQLINMGFQHTASMNAAKMYPNDLNLAINAVVSLNDDVNVNDNKHVAVKQNENNNHDEMKNQEEKKEELSPKDSMEKQFYKFLEDMRMEQYFDKFKEMECCDMDSIEYFDNDTLKNEIGIGSIIARKKFLGKCRRIKEEMDEFKNDYGISSVLCKQLEKYGIVTLDILCAEVENKSNLKQKYKIANENACDMLWNLIQQNKLNQQQQEGQNDHIK